MSLHCWADGPTYCLRHGWTKEGQPTTDDCDGECWDLDGILIGSTCMEEAEHSTPHVWLRDDNIGVSFETAEAVS